MVNFIYLIHHRTRIERKKKIPKKSTKKKFYSTFFSYLFKPLFFFSFNQTNFTLKKMSENAPLLGVPPVPAASDMPEVTNNTNNTTNRSQRSQSFWKKNSLTWRLALIILITCMGSMQFGYHMAELNAPQRYLTCDYLHGDVSPKGSSLSSSSSVSSSVFNNLKQTQRLKTCVEMSDQQYGVITAIFSIGGLVGSFYAGRFADYMGRKNLSIVNAMMSLIGSLVLTLSDSYWQFIVGRLIVGMAAGSSIVVVPLMITEIAPVSMKGVFGSMNQGSINIGILVVQFFSLFWARPKKWRYLFVAGIVIACIQLILLVFLFEESPKWLYNKGELRKAEKVLMGLRPGSRTEVKREIEEWGHQSRNSQASGSVGAGMGATNSTPYNRDVTFWEYLTGPRYFKTRLLVTVILVGQQFTGINSIILYGVSVVGNLAKNSRTPIKVNFGISILNVVVTIGASPLIDHFGRKPLLISSSVLMGIAAYMVSIGLHFEKLVFLILMIFGYIGFFALGVGPIPFLIIPELSPSNALGAAQSYGTVCNWIGTFIVAYGFPVLSDMIGITSVFLMFATFAILFAIYLFFTLPETRGKSNYNEVWGIDSSSSSPYQA